jgi:hypothetical protein
MKPHLDFSAYIADHICNFTGHEERILEKFQLSKKISMCPIERRLIRWHVKNRLLAALVGKNALSMLHVSG